MRGRRMARIVPLKSDGHSVKSVKDLLRRRNTLDIIFEMIDVRMLLR